MPQIRQGIPEFEMKVTTMKNFPLSVFVILLLAFTTGCTSIPHGVDPVAGFDADRYLGTWHEIARLDHRFERGLTHVTAEYTRRDDGAISVLNRGFDPQSGDWREANGVAKFTGDSNVASLKVSFFWPFYGGYHVIALDHEHYQWAMVSGPTKKYLWILAREQTLDPEIIDTLLERARALKYPVDEIIFVDQAS